MIEPLHIGTIAGQQVRFFRSPLADGRPDLPWHCVDDLHRALGLNRAQRKIFLSKLRTWREHRVQTVAAAEGVLTLAPHFMAQGTVDALVADGITPASVGDEYDRASAAALKKLTHQLGITFPHDRLLAWMRDAMNRWEES
jgi:hypothetical protein